MMLIEIPDPDVILSVIVAFLVALWYPWQIVHHASARIFPVCGQPSRQGQLFLPYHEYWLKEDF